MTDKATGCAPYFIVSDVIKLAEYYRDSLGFEELTFYGEPTAFCIARMGKAHIMLSRQRDAKDPNPNRALSSYGQDAYIWVTDFDAHYEFCKSSGAEIIKHPVGTSYGMREFEVQDPDGYVICFGAASEA